MAEKLKTAMYNVKCINYSLELSQTLKCFQLRADILTTTTNSNIECRIILDTKIFLKEKYKNKETNKYYWNNLYCH